MAYIGKSPDGTGVRSRFYFTATGGETSLSGTDDNNATLAFADGAYVDVYLNGLLLVAGTDYNTSTANTIAGLTALAANDIVEILVFDIFTVADTVSASAGGTFSANVAITGDLTVDTNTLVVDAANNRVGLGTATPAKKLTVDGDADFNVALRSASTRTGIGFYAPGTGSLGNPAGSMLLLSDNTFRMGTASVYGLIMEQNGTVTTPSQPSFLARGITGQPSIGNAFVFNGTDFNRGNCYSTSNGRFTAPVNGFYIFTCHIMSDSTDGRLMIRLFKNGTHMSQGSSSSNTDQYQDSRIAFMMYMASGDYAEVHYQGTKGRYDNGPTHCHFAGHLLG